MSYILDIFFILQVWLIYSQIILLFKYLMKKSRITPSWSAASSEFHSSIILAIRCLFLLSNFMSYFLFLVLVGSFTTRYCWSGSGNAPCLTLNAIL